MKPTPRSILRPLARRGTSDQSHETSSSCAAAGLSGHRLPSREPSSLIDDDTYQFTSSAEMIKPREDDEIPLDDEGESDGNDMSYTLPSLSASRSSKLSEGSSTDNKSNPDYSKLMTELEPQLSRSSVASERSMDSILVQAQRSMDEYQRRQRKLPPLEEQAMPPSGPDRSSIKLPSIPQRMSKRFPQRPSQPQERRLADICDAKLFVSESHQVPQHCFVRACHVCGESLCIQKSAIVYRCPACRGMGAASYE